MKKSLIQFITIIPLALLLCLTFSCQKQGEEVAEEAVAKVAALSDEDVAAIKSIGPALDEADLAEAKELDRRFVEAMSNKDLDAAMACFWNSPDLVVVLFGNVLLGADAVRSGIAQMFAQNESVKLTVNEATYLPAGDGVITVGTATYNLQPASGPRQQIVERWSDLKRKIDGRWVYVLDHATVVPK